MCGSLWGNATRFKILTRILVIYSLRLRKRISLAALLPDCLYRSLEYVGLAIGVPPFQAHLFNPPRGDTSDDEQRTLWTHVRLSMEMLHQVILYGIQPMTPPWGFCTLLDSSYETARPSLDMFMNMYELVLMLESSKDPQHAVLLRQCSRNMSRILRRTWLAMPQGSKTFLEH